jgi:hypothetical protein
MCCFSTIFLVLGSRIAVIIWWLTDPARFNLAFRNWGLAGYPIPVWIWSLLGGLFLPWTTLAYLFVVPGGVVGYDWLVIIPGFVIDMTSHGGSYYHRNRVPMWRRRSAI